jgi:hypothetical protein
VKAFRTTATYALPVPVRDFLALTHREARYPEKPDLGSELDAMKGVDNTEYNGHFGSFIYYRVTVEHDTDETHAAVAACVERHLHPRKNQCTD